MCHINNEKKLSLALLNFKEIDNVLKIYKKQKKNNLAILHCVSNYPCKLSSINLNCLQLFKKKYKNLTIGYSDHSTNSSAVCLSVALGAKIIEKHITLNKKDIGPDHKASADFHDFKKMIKYIRESEVILGKSEKKIQREELDMLKISRKSFYYKKNFKKGEKIKKQDLLLLRPNKGILPSEIKNILHKKLKKNVLKSNPVRLDHFIKL